MDCFLRRLDNLRREFAPLLDGSEQWIDGVAAGLWFSEDVGRGNGILDRKVDADTADRRHGVGGIADRDQPRPPPALETVE